ncbi:MAG: hypothetical protein LBP59_16670 [Planctomycetaceae bacterium]|nr:hypothetical protein [Planctomycetaceae bacterium]
MSTTACRRDACDPSDDFLLQKIVHPVPPVPLVTIVPLVPKKLPIHNLTKKISINDYQNFNL